MVFRVTQTTVLLYKHNQILWEHTKVVKKEPFWLKRKPKALNFKKTKPSIIHTWNSVITFSSCTILFPVYLTFSLYHVTKTNVIIFAKYLVITIV